MGTRCPVASSPAAGLAQEWVLHPASQRLLLSSSIQDPHALGTSGEKAWLLRQQVAGWMCDVTARGQALLALLSVEAPLPTEAAAHGGSAWTLCTSDL